MADSINLTRLTDKLKENIADYSRIFQLKLANGFDVKSDPLFTVLPIKDKVPLIRAIANPVLQPGRKGTVNFTDNAVELANRFGGLNPFKVDLRLDEKTLYAWGKNYLGSKKPTDPSDIYSFNAMGWYMSQIITRIGKDMNGVIYNGVLNSGGTSNVDIADGLKLLFTQGFATTGVGAVGDIPADNVITAAATIDQTNVLGEINKLAMRVLDTLDEADEPAVLNLDPSTFAHMVNALNATLSNGSQVVYREGADYKLALLPNTVIRKRTWLKGTGGKMFWTVYGNLFWLAREEDTSDVPSIDIEKQDRAIKIFIDGEMGINYGDGRMIFMNSK